MKPFGLILLFSAAVSAHSLPGWMSGTWRSTADGATSEEIWSAADGTLMTGTHRDLRPGKATWFEFLRIEKTESGLTYVAMPGGSDATRFPAVEVEPMRITFENPEHDFPKRILYWREGETLCARVEGDDGEGEQWCWRGSSTEAVQKCGCAEMCPTLVF